MDTLEAAVATMARIRGCWSPSSSPGGTRIAFACVAIAPDDAHLNQRGVPVEHILFPDEGHGFRKTPNRIRAAVAIVRWFVQHLKA